MIGMNSAQNLQQQSLYLNYVQNYPSVYGGSQFSKKRYSMPEPNQMMQQDNISDHLSNERMVYHQNAHKIDNQANHKKQAKSFVVS